MGLEISPLKLSLGLSQASEVQNLSTVTGHSGKSFGAEAGCSGTATCLEYTYAYTCVHMHVTMFAPFYVFTIVIIIIIVTSWLLC